MPLLQCLLLLFCCFLQFYLFNFLYPFSSENQNHVLANSVDPGKMAHNGPSHQDPLPFCFDLLTETPILNNGFDQIQSWKTPG